MNNIVSKDKQISRGVERTLSTLDETASKTGPKKRGDDQ